MSQGMKPYYSTECYLADRKAAEEARRATEIKEAQAAAEQAAAEAHLSVPPVDDDRKEPSPVATKKPPARRKSAQTSPTPRRRGKKKKVFARKSARLGETISRLGRQLVKAPEPQLAPLLTTPALLRGEDPAEYATFLESVIERVRPVDGVEYVLVYDFTARSWEMARYRRLKASYLRSREPDGLAVLLRDLQVPDPERSRLIKGWLSGDPPVRSEVRVLLTAAGWDETIITARCLGMSLKVIDGIESQLIMAEASRVAAWRALIRHRSDLAERFAQPQALIDAAFTECIDNPDATDDVDDRGDEGDVG